MQTILPNISMPVWGFESTLNMLEDVRGMNIPWDFTSATHAGFHHPLKCMKAPQEWAVIGSEGHKEVLAALSQSTGPFILKNAGMPRDFNSSVSSFWKPDDEVEIQGD
jgi:hypothetical protein